jgi:hypothetical protein
MADRVLSRSLNLFDEEEGHVRFPAYTRESEIPRHLREKITNPKAWITSDELEERLGLPPGMTKQDLINALKATGELSEEDIESLRGEDGGGEGLNKLTVPQLRTLAEQQEVDLGGATRKNEIVKILNDAGLTLDDFEDEEDAG